MGNGKLNLSFNIAAKSQRGRLLKIALSCLVLLWVNNSYAAKFTTPEQLINDFESRIIQNNTQDIQQLIHIPNEISPSQISWAEETLIGHINHEHKHNGGVQSLTMLPMKYGYQQKNYQLEITVVITYKNGQTATENGVLIYADGQ